MLSSVRFLFAATVGLLVFATPGIAATPIGKVVAVVGSPTGSGRPLTAGSAVYENDRLQTGGGNIQIIFVDNTKLVVGPNSTLVIDRFLLRGGNRAGKFSVAALRGTFRFISGNSAKSAYDIRTTNATIGIRGTAFDFSSGRTSLVAVLDGLVRFCSAGDCEPIPRNCGVGRATRGNVEPLSGRAKGRALRSLPFILNQASLSRPFRLNTQSCRAVLTIYDDFFGGGQNNSTRPEGASGAKQGGDGGDGGGGGEGGNVD
jgi:hypothetical protein